MVQRTMPNRGQSPGLSPRLGPRPLPVHLGLASTIWLSALGGLPLARAGAVPWDPTLRADGSVVGSALAAADAGELSEALSSAVRARFAGFTRGVEAYWAHPYRRDAPTREAVWQAGTTTLRDHRPANAPKAEVTALVVPSLVNRAYILDLAPGRSLTDYLAARGVRSLVVDWDEPGEAERSFDLTDYVEQRLAPALDAACALAGGPVPVVGYCMGGTLAVALAQARPEQVSALALLATPWDFHADDPGCTQVLAALEPMFAPVVVPGAVMPVDMLQVCFAVLQPTRVADKFRAFARLEPDGPDALAFVQVEDWLNDGVPLAGPAAAECLFGWYGENKPAREEWRIGGRAVRPSDLALPTLTFIPARDRVVPPGSALALAQAIPGAMSAHPRAGHIGMVAGRKAESECWRPLFEWLLARAK